MIDVIPESDFDVQLEGQVEIIGWLYQYYNEEPHNAVVNINGGTVKTNDIPAATQLFTTDWVVRYMVDNSLGKYYLERNTHSDLATQLEFLLPDSVDAVSEDLDVTKIKIIDNAMGSGHILVYAFDVLMKMYAEQGYSSREASRLILENNLFGLEIDKRSYQLAYFALLMKAREYNRRSLTSGISPKVYVFEDTSNIDDNYFENLPVSEDIIQDLKYVISLYRNSRTLGSIIQIRNTVNTGSLRTALANIPQETSLDLNNTREITRQLLRLLDIVETMQNKYEIVITNPPYLNKMNKVLKDYVKAHYKNYSSDLFSVFIWHNINMTTHNGYSAYMTPFVWMFIKSYEHLRKSILDNKLISSLIQMEYSAFEEATVPINTFVLKNTNDSEEGLYIKLSDFKGDMNFQKEKVLEAIKNPNVDYLYRTNQAIFNMIPGRRIIYWASDVVLKDFQQMPVANIAFSDGQILTGNNKKYLKMLWEVDVTKIGPNRDWALHAKGGEYKRWSGNIEWVVDVSNNAMNHYKSDSVARFPKPEILYRPGVTWTLVSSSPSFASRILKPNSTFNKAAATILFKDESLIYMVLAFLNSSVGGYFKSMLNPTLNNNIQDILDLPLILTESPFIENKVDDNISLVDADWDSFETSFEFKHHPLMTHIDDHKQICFTLALLNHINVPNLSQKLI